MVTTVIADMVVFDADFTLIDPRPGRRAALEALFSEYGIGTPVSVFETELYARSAGNILRALHAEGVFGAKAPDEVLRQFLGLEGELVSATTLCPGALDALYGSLRANAIATRSPTELLLRRLEAGLGNAAELTDAEDPQVSEKVTAVAGMLAEQRAAGAASRIVAANSSASGRGKPFPDPVETAFRNLASVLNIPYDPSRCLMIGDSNEDTYAGLLAGAVTVRSQFSDGVLGDVFVLPTEVQEHITVPDLTHIRLRRQDNAIALETSAGMRHVDLGHVREVVNRLGVDLEGKNARWPALERRGNPQGPSSDRPPARPAPPRQSEGACPPRRT